MPYQLVAYNLMMPNLSTIFGLQGTIGPVPYLISGLLAFGLKYSIDLLAALLLVHRPWLPWQYLNPLGTTVRVLALGPEDRWFLAVMSVIALPFIWFGISLTVRRLRSAGLPAAMVVLFFIPLVNLGFFLVLSFLPARIQVGTSSAPRINASGGGNAIVAIGISIPICLSAVWLATRLPSYGLGLFLAVPFCLGLVSVLIYTRNTRRSYGSCVRIAITACTLAGVVLLGVAIEGAICLLMAAPIILVLAILGATVAYAIQQHAFGPREMAAVLLLLALFPPLVIAAESIAPRAVPEFAVRTAVEVNAPPSRVWQNVVSFSQLPDPQEWVFRAGVAYPIRADIQGRGAGAVRRCIFSTGPFIEPITIWDEPRLLEFSVVQNPPPMREWSPYSNLHPPHLDGYLVSHKGRFLLTPLPGGRTRLEGVTWYVHNLWPSSYWRFWSDFIIHRIHLRVLEHIKREAELVHGELARGE